MNAREEADRLKQEAIQLLLKERASIDDELRALGYDKEKAPAKKRGRPPKIVILESAREEENQADGRAEALPPSRPV